MKTYFFTFLFSFLSINISVFLESKKPVTIITPPVPALEEIINDAVPMIFFITPKTNTLDITFLSLFYFTDWNYNNPSHSLSKYGITTYDIQNATFSPFLVNNYAPPSFRNQSDLTYTGSTIIKDETTITLQDYISGTVNGGNDYTSEHRITRIRYSPRNQYLGILSHFVWKNTFVYDVTESDEILLYSSQNGEPIYFRQDIIQGNSGDSNALGMGNGDCELYLSPDENFLIGRYFKYDYNKEFGLNFFHPKISMIDVKNKEAVEADKDVAFTSDSQFFVTERNGEPCLVRSSSKNTVLTYQIGAPMLAAAFSPDDKTLYLSAIDNKIYVYDSGIDSACEDWELLK